MGVISKILLLIGLAASPTWAQFNMPDEGLLRANKPFASGSSATSYATVVNTAGTSISPTCSATSGTHPSRDLVWQVLTGATTYTTPAAASNCLDGDVIEGVFYQADNSANAFQVGLAAGSGVTNAVPCGLYATPSGTGSNTGYYIHFALEYSAAKTQWKLIGQDTSPYTAVQVCEGGSGATTLTAHGPLVGEGTSPVVATASGSSGQYYRSNGAADPSFQNRPYDVGASISGTPGNAQVIATIPCRRTINFSASLASSGIDTGIGVSCGTSPTGSSDIYLLKLDTTTECTLTVSTATPCAVAVTTCTSGWSCASGHVLTVVAPAVNAGSAGNTAANVGFVIGGDTAQ